MQQIYGFPRELPPDVDFYVLSNEDVGFETALTTGSNDVYQFAMPYPSSMEIDDETIIVHAIEFMLHAEHKAKGGGGVQNLLVYLSMLDIDFTATFRGGLGDTDDEAMKSKFAGPMFIGESHLNVTAVASVEGTQRFFDNVISALYYPPVPLDLLTPLYVDLVNSAVSVTLATNAAAAANFTDVDKFTMKVWFTIRKLTKAEKDARSVQLRFQRLDS